MDELFTFNPGLPSRFPFHFNFEDFGALVSCSHALLQRAVLIACTPSPEYAELHAILCGMVAEQRYRAEAAKPLRIAARRLAAGRGVPGFGNGRAVRSFLEQGVRRQQDRLGAARKDGTPLGEAVNVLTAADLLGPRKMPTQLDAVRQLESMQGLAAVKAQVHALLAMMSENMRREENEEQPLQVCLNRLFLGNPGTGAC